MRRTEMLQLDTAGIFCGWTLRGYSTVEHSAVGREGHCRDILRLGAAGVRLCIDTVDGQNRA